ncbi:hypothetical protein A0H81_01390 [Grifola frondosa]|uniref:Uncharacterized protein n=1 Tax=Grifola frondosa TaxID=5627 RepID=A0A1C7MQT1_GRIFR|nr:hypothetical protein A0H81_01390 [Grifola frondosa]
MPRSNRTLSDIFVSGRPQYPGNTVITPRTPHSRSGLAEEGYTEVELEQLRNDDADDDYRTHAQQQSEPLLVSSSSATFPSGYRSRGDDNDILGKTSGISWLKLLVEKSALIGASIMVCMLLVLVAVAIKRPGVLDHAILQTPTGPLDIPGLQDDRVAAPPSPSFVDTVPPEGRLISYENYTRFPLSRTEYRYECNKIMGGFMHHGDYWDAHVMGPLDVVHHDDVTNYHLPEGQRTQVCSKTLTYMLDGHVGLMADLALMAQAAALARERGRTFLVDDTYWNRGKWTDHFQDIRALEPGPEPGCRAPPPEELVACPRQARHWVISSQTAKFHFGHPFSEEYEDPKLRPGRTRYLDPALPQLLADPPAAHRIHPESKPEHFPAPPITYVASDSPDAIREFISAFPSSTALFALAISTNPELRALAPQHAYVQAEFAAEDAEERVRLTKGMIVDFAMVSGLWAWDGDVVPGAIVCGITSNVCKLSALGFGFERAFGFDGDGDYSTGGVNDERKRWVEIDDKGVIDPIWRGFELFN